MAGTGQPAYHHACKKCLHIYSKDGILSTSLVPSSACAILMRHSEYITAVIMDGVTLGHCCCRVKDCQVHLVKIKDRFCPHHDSLSMDCLVNGCQSPHSPGHVTCEEHRLLEHQPADQTSLSQLTARSKRVGVTTNKSSSQKTKDKRRQQNPTNPELKSKRTWTHNEQLIVRPCGIVVSRATMFSSEGVASANVSGQGYQRAQLLTVICKGFSQGHFP